MEKIPADCKLDKDTPICKKVMEIIIPGTIERHLKNKDIIRLSQQEFIKGKSCLSDLISFCDKITCLVHEGRSVDIIFLDFCKAFDTDPHGTLLKTVLLINRFTFSQVMNWHDGRAQSVAVNGSTFGWQMVSSDIPQGSILKPLIYINTFLK